MAVAVSPAVRAGILTSAALLPIAIFFAACGERGAVAELGRPSHTETCGLLPVEVARTVLHDPTVTAIGKAIGACEYADGDATLMLSTSSRSELEHRFGRDEDDPSLTRLRDLAVAGEPRLEPALGLGPLGLLRPSAPTDPGLVVWSRDGKLYRLTFQPPSTRPGGASAETMLGLAYAVARRS